LDDRAVAEGSEPSIHHGHHPPNEEHTTMADKSPRQHQSKKSGKSLKEKRTEKKGKQATKRPIT